MKLKSVDCETLFPTPFWYIEYEDYEPVNRAIVEEIAKVDWQAEQRRRGLQDVVEQRYREDTFITPELVPSCKHILGAFAYNCGEIARALEWELEDKAIYVTELWAHITPPGKNTQSHDHCGAHLSCAYYVRVPQGSGNLRFVDDRKHRQLEPRLSVQMEVPSKEGSMVIFPGWVTHYVDENRSGEPRISISMNGSLLPKHADTNGIRLDLPARA